MSVFNSHISSVVKCPPPKWKVGCSIHSHWVNCRISLGKTVPGKKHNSGLSLPSIAVAPSRGPVVPFPHLKYVFPFHIWPPGCCIHPTLYLKNVAPLVFFCPPCCEILAMGLNKNRENLCCEQTHVSVLIWFETIIEYLFNYSSSFKFSFATQTLNICNTVFVAQDVFDNAGNILRWWYLSLIVGVRLSLH